MYLYIYSDINLRNLDVTGGATVVRKCFYFNVVQTGHIVFSVS